MIIKKIIQNPQNYKTIIQQASFDELKEVYTTYMKHYTSENVYIMVQSYTESALREKLLGCSRTVMDTLSKMVQK